MTPFIRRRLLRELQQAMEADTGRDVPWSDVVAAADIAFGALKRQVAATTNRLPHGSEFDTLWGNGVAMLTKMLRDGEFRRRGNPPCPWSGSPKQIEWAKRIRAQLLTRVRAFDAAAASLSLPGRSVQVRTASTTTEQLRIAQVWAEQTLPRIVDARWLIDHRDDSAPLVLAAVQAYTGPLDG